MLDTVCPRSDECDPHYPVPNARTSWSDKKRCLGGGRAGSGDEPRPAPGLDRDPVGPPPVTVRHRRARRTVHVDRAAGHPAPGGDDRTPRPCRERDRGAPRGRGPGPDPVRADAIVPPTSRGGGRGRRLLPSRRPRSRLGGSRVLGQRHERLHEPGRVDDHPAIREERADRARALDRAEGPRGDPRREARAHIVQARDPRGVSQHRVLRPRRLRGPGGGSDLLRSRRQGPLRAAVGDTGGSDRGPVGSRPLRVPGGGAPLSELRARSDRGGRLDRRGGSPTAAGSPASADRGAVGAIAGRPFHGARPARPQASYGLDALYRGGLRVKTTLDTEWQRAAERAIRSHLPGPRGPEAALVAIDPRTGAIRAMVGGRSFARSEFNLATQGRRQAGSAFKPFVLLAALERGISPTEVRYGLPR